jgi:RNA-dependent RNA polymerase
LKVLQNIVAYNSVFISFTIGGDLDGDLYFVTWSDDFKPRRDIHEPMNYPALNKRLNDGPITVRDMVEFYAEYIESDVLGKT